MSKNSKGDWWAVIGLYIILGLSGLLALGAGVLWSAEGIATLVVLILIVILINWKKS